MCHLVFSCLCIVFAVELLYIVVVVAALVLWGGRGGQVISSTPDVGQMEEPLSAHQRTYTLIYFFDFDLI